MRTLPPKMVQVLAPFAPLFSAHSGHLHRLGIHHARAGLRIPPQAHPQAFADGPVDLSQIPSMRHFLKYQ
jgi:hypothetical protein